MINLIMVFNDIIYELGQRTQTHFIADISKQYRF
jgi:hypothetical protein